MLSHMTVEFILRFFKRAKCNLKRFEKFLCIVKLIKYFKKVHGIVLLSFMTLKINQIIK